MRLLEYQGKELLARSGVAVPAGILVADAQAPGDWPAPCFLKAQIPVGKRQRCGAVRRAATRCEAAEVATRLLQLTVGKTAVRQLLVEPEIPVSRELYAAILTDRERSIPTLIMSGSGGVSVESTASTDLCRQDIDPFFGVQHQHARCAAAHMGLPVELEPVLAQVLRGLWKAFDENDATLLEVNPLALTADGRLVALDAKVVLDDRGERASRIKQSQGASAFEATASELGATGVEMDGQVVAISSGAGCLMATLDSLAARGLSMAGAIDLGVFVRSDEALVTLFESPLLLRPALVVCNFFTQVTDCEQLARCLAAAALSEHGTRVVVRLKGPGSEKGRALLTAAGIVVTESFSEVAELAAAALAGGG